MPSHPTIEARPLDSGGWCVQIVWPDRPDDRVTGFCEKQDAHAWIEDESQAWIKART